MLMLYNLNPNLKIYLEYSNEVWNTNFTQTHEIGAFAQNLGYTGQLLERSRKYTAKRSADIFHTFETVFQGNERLVKVIPGWAGSAFHNDQLLTFFNDPLYNPNMVTADALAIAPYFGNGIGNNIGNNGQIETITVSEILDLLETELTTAYNRMDLNKEVANTYNLDLIAYEAGQHLVAQGVYQQNNTLGNILTNKLTQANRDERIEDMYCEYINYWYETTQGGLLSFFSSHQPYGRFGSWGIKEYMDEEDTPKYNAITSCVFNYNTLSIPTTTTTKTSFKMYPNPAFKTINVSNEGKVESLELYTMDGKQVLKVKGTNTINIETLASGMFLLKVIGVDGTINFNKIIIE